MKAVAWCAPHLVRVEEAPDPAIINPRDAIVRVTSTCICGSDLHLVDGFIPFMKPGDILGHEPMGIVEEVGPAVDPDKIKVGDRVVVPFPIGCGECFFCQRQMWSCCENTNPKPSLGETMHGHATAGIFGYSHLTGGYAGGQAQYLRTPLADVNLQKMPEDLTDDQLVFLSDILPTGWMAAEQADIQPDDTVAIWGCGPVGQFTLRSAVLMGAHRVIAIDDESSVPERMQMAREGGAETIDMNSEDVPYRLFEMTGGLGPDSCIDAVGMESHGYHFLGSVYDRVKTSLMLETERPHAFRQAVKCCRKGGTLSVPGVYGGFADKIPLGAIMNKGLTIKTGQTHVHKYVPKLLDEIRQGRIDPSFVITHRLPLSEAPHGYEIFRKKQDGCIKVVLDPAA
ncbi:Glutathione-independent formaldehyde dehydrogenase [Botrimarina colliarenosi]|uniref:Glutathione-independent formaldehyde dehydrogenase n=1 Tax=Botrimarina colliarenosi TaxID=2528001 RepID=A0A5C6A425_9BACT|nr:zinc-dependent alcohol dehydrogenase [Botrimarina colliarenosi]TWT94125.1 Glutathione-independent formaldehyde dehydrogenase [Botrimarina colliarenosi]